VATWKKADGFEQPSKAAAFANLAALYWAQERWADAASSLRDAVRIQEANIQRTLLLGDEARKRAYIATLSGSTAAIVTFSLASIGKNPDAEALGLNVVLQRKGRIQDVVADSFAAVRSSLSESNRRILEEWRTAIEQLSSLISRPSEIVETEQDSKVLEGLTARAKELEAELSQRSAEVRNELETVTVERVQRKIPAGAALIEWFRYQPFNPKAKGNELRWAEPRYVAYLLKKEGSPVAVDIGEAKPIETAVADLLAAIEDRAPISMPELIRQLDIWLMGPLYPHLTDTEQLLLSPDGMLNLLPFGVLQGENGRYLVQEKQITYLTSGRDFLRPSSGVPNHNGPVVFANPDFGPKGDTQVTVSVSQIPTDFDSLDGAASEAEAVKTILGLKDDQVLTNSQATETALKEAKGPRILHIATHGFFFAHQYIDRETISRSVSGEDKLPAAKWQNPLTLSGLVLAGANVRRSGKDDGILFAQEVSGLDLTGTELAVLSACETGKGRVDNGEGVYGLRRAFVLAGVRAQLASLWKVEDGASRDLMIDYYTRLKKGDGRSQALRKAQLAMLKDPKHPTRAHPYYWAAFVLIGDGTPLNP
jgi:CHAT domain-containing protein